MPSALKYAAACFVKIDDVRDGKQREKISFCKEEPSQYGKDGKQLVLTFESGRKLSLNGTNTGELCREVDEDFDRWAGHEVELYAGTVGKGANMRDALLLRVLTPTTAQQRREIDPEAEAKRPEMDDEIPSERGASKRRSPRAALSSRSS